MGELGAEQIRRGIEAVRRPTSPRDGPAPNSCGWRRPIGTPRRRRSPGCSRSSTAARRARAWIRSSSSRRRSRSSGTRRTRSGPQGDAATSWPARRHGGRPSVGGPQQRSPARGRGRHRRDREGRRRRAGRSCRSAACRGSASAGTRPGSRSPATRSARTTSGSGSHDRTRCSRCSEPATSTRWSPTAIRSGPSLLVQQRARRPVRRRREHRGQRHRRRDHRTSTSDDHLAHTNHYVSERMRPYEGDPDYAVRSDVRFCRARDLLADQPPGSVTPEVLRDHPLRPREPAGRGLPASRVGSPDVQDRLLVHRGRDRRPGALRSREPVRLDGRRSTCSPTTAPPEARTGSARSWRRRRSRSRGRRRFGPRRSSRRGPLRRRGAAPRSSRSPFIAAAWRGVHPADWRTSGFAPASRRIRTTSDWRRLTAECSAVPVIHPRPNASTSAPRSMSSRGRLGLAEERREVQGREPVARVGGRQRRFAVEDLS